VRSKAAHVHDHWVFVALLDRNTSVCCYLASSHIALASRLSDRRHRFRSLCPSASVAMSSYSASLAEPFPPPIQGCIFVQTSTGETIEIKVPVKDTVWSVYKKIQDQFDIKPHFSGSSSSGPPQTCWRCRQLSRTMRAVKDEAKTE
jgi:hypothetical protein